MIRGVTLLIAIMSTLMLVASPSLLFGVEWGLIIIMAVAGWLWQKHPLTMGIIMIGCLGIMQILFLWRLPNNMGISPAFLLAPMILYQWARDKRLEPRWPQGLALLLAAASLISPLMWRVHQYDFGYGLIRIHGIDLVVTMVAHWAIIGAIFLWGRSNRTTEITREREAVREARLLERNRIAAEVHDALAHTLTLIRMQASAGLYAPEQAPDILRSIQEISGAGITEVRAIVAALRSDDIPDTMDMSDVIRRFHDSGLDVTARTDPLTDLPIRLRLAIHRIVTETLVNVVKHQENPQVTVDIAVGECVTITVVSHGPKKPDSSGTGVGLPSLDERAQAVGGTFEFAFDRHNNCATPPGNTMTVKILIADDQVLLSRALATILGSQPDLEVVATVHDGQAAVDTVAHTPVDLILMDVRMPKLDGVAALKKIRAKPNPPKIVMLTTFNVPDTVKAALTAGANGFLLKDADPETLIESVRTVAAGQTVLAADVVGHILPGALTVAADTLPSHVQQGLSLLTPREMEVLHAIGEGKTNAEIAAELVISATTVKTHVSNLLAKVHARDRVALAIIARKVGL